MSKFAAGEDSSNPKTLRELIQKKFLDEVVGCAGTLTSVCNVVQFLTLSFF
jgi:hypothetical protein